jgi:hypothetical protein
MKENEKKAYFLGECAVVEKECLQGKLVLKPYWWKDLEKIKLPKNKEHLRPGYMVLFKEVYISKIINKLKSRNKEVLLEKSLTQKYLDAEKTFNIISLWSKKKALLPPTITVGCEGGLEISDGRHRLNIANYLGASVIPILVANIDLAEVCVMLDLDMGKF